MIVAARCAGKYAASKATVANAITYYVDAFTGDIVRIVDDKNYQTGSGTGRHPAAQTAPAALKL